MFKSLILPFVLLVSTLFLSCREDDTFEMTDGNISRKVDTTTVDTGLPIIKITTDDRKGITDKENWKVGTLVFERNDSFGGISDSIWVKGRGNASFHYPKKSFTLKFEHKQSLLGMPKHKRWVFQANYHDRTLLRNALTFHLSHFADGMEWNPHAKFAEIIFNGEHIGNYLVCEQIRANKNRVPISSTSEEEEDSGFIFEYDYYFDSWPRFRSPICHFPICIKYPDEGDCQVHQMEYAQSFIKKVEVLLFTRKYDKLFDKYLDLDSFVDYWIIMTISGNIEPAKPRSVYFYKKPSGKLYAGPLWDFDYSTYNRADGTDNKSVLYYMCLFKSQLFRERVKVRWKELNPVLRQEAVNFIMYQSSYLSKSVEINYTLWPIIPPYLKKCENGDESLSFQEALDNLLRITMARMDYVEEIVRNF